MGIWGLYTILRGRVRDLVFGEESSTRVRVEAPNEDELGLRGQAEGELVEVAADSAERTAQNT